MADQHPGRRRVIAVVGDAVLPEGDVRREHAYALGRGIVDQGWVVVTGGRGGVMEAAGRGARDSERWGSGASMAILPGHDPSAANPYVDIALPTGLDVARNTLVAHADAVVAVGGGAGTLSEMALAWQLMRLVIGIEGEGWAGRLAGEPMDGRRRYPEIPDDCVRAARGADHAITLLMRWLPQYGQDHPGIGR
ncbi:MAG: TIGR00725 family protein [Myxococcota bacterium]